MIIYDKILFFFYLDIALLKMGESKKISISFSKAKEVLDEYRYKPRREWSKRRGFF